uniref:Uncharacterized protein n=2 Tax=Grammatophora oceanica TaxID=210454 RepID=A0A7S1Y5U6_9STRA|mmetsp:Transcript_29017/g.42651  ORF Transcript_29017/g.42651 Transcript_29017/m.42651 type:complete len:890 (+) Transcript_29017:227-2896(+)
MEEDMISPRRYNRSRSSSSDFVDRTSGIEKHLEALNSLHGRKAKVFEEDEVTVKVSHTRRDNVPNDDETTRPPEEKPSSAQQHRRQQRRSSWDSPSLSTTLCPESVEESVQDDPRFSAVKELSGGSGLPRPGRATEPRKGTMNRRCSWDGSSHAASDLTGDSCFLDHGSVSTLPLSPTPSAADHETYQEGDITPSMVGDVESDQEGLDMRSVKRTMMMVKHVKLGASGATRRASWSEPDVSSGDDCAPAAETGNWADAIQTLMADSDFMAAAMDSDDDMAVGDDQRVSASESEGPSSAEPRNEGRPAQSRRSSRRSSRTLDVVEPSRTNEGRPLRRRSSSRTTLEIGEPQVRRLSATEKPNWNEAIERMMQNPALVEALKETAKSNQAPTASYESDASGYMSGASATSVPIASIASKREKTKRRSSWSDPLGTKKSGKVAVRKASGSQEPAWMQAIQGMMQDPSFVEALKECTAEEEAGEDGARVQMPPVAASYESDASAGYKSGASAKSMPSNRPREARSERRSSWSNPLDAMEPRVRQLSGSQKPEWTAAIAGMMDDPEFAETLKECALEEEVGVQTLLSVEESVGRPNESSRQNDTHRAPPKKEAPLSETDESTRQGYSGLDDDDDDESILDEWAQIVQRYEGSEGPDQQQQGGRRQPRRSSWHGDTLSSGLSSMSVQTQDTVVSLPSPLDGINRNKSDAAGTNTANRNASNQSIGTSDQTEKMQQRPTYYVDLDDPESAPPPGSLPLARQSAKGASSSAGNATKTGGASSEDDAPTKDAKSSRSGSGLFRSLASTSSRIKTGTEPGRARNSRFRSRLGSTRSVSPVRGHLVVTTSNMPTKGVRGSNAGFNPALLNSPDTSNGIHCVQLTAMGDVATCNFGVYVRN